MSLQQLRAERDKIGREIRRQSEAINAEGRDFTPEERAAWEAANRDYDSLQRRVKVNERLAEVEGNGGHGLSVPHFFDFSKVSARLPGPPSVQNKGDLALSAWFRQAVGLELTREQEAACHALNFNPKAKNLEIPLADTRFLRSAQHLMERAFARTNKGVIEQIKAERSAGRTTSDELAFIAAQRLSHDLVNDPDISAALSGETGPAGGYLYPEGFIRNLEINMLSYGGILRVADIIRTDGGERIPWPTADTTTILGRRTAENKTVLTAPTVADPAFGQVFWDAYLYDSNEVLVPYRLFEDSVLDVPEVMGQLLGERIGRKFAADCTTGTGANQPVGIVTAAPIGVTTANANALTMDEILTLVASVDAAHREAPTAGFLMADTTMWAIRKLKDGIGRYLWSDETDKLWNYPYTIAQEMAAIGPSTIPLLFGNVKKYKVRMVKSIRIVHLIERNREFDQETFIGYQRLDGNLLTAGTAPVKSLQMHA